MNARIIALKGLPVLLVALPILYVVFLLLFVYAGLFMLITGKYPTKEMEDAVNDAFVHSVHAGEGERNV